MSATNSVRDEAAQAAADFGAAADAVDTAAAALFGINRTDLRILGLVFDAGTMAAGPLAAAAALSPAATSTAIQRLVAAGHLSRGVDQHDRRRAVVALTPSATTLLNQVYGPLARAGMRELTRYSADELAVIVDFLRRGIRLQLAQADRVRGLTPSLGLTHDGGGTGDSVSGRGRGTRGQGRELRRPAGRGGPGRAGGGV
jgi:DNA-binding MarR family transcriptional regulator